MSEDVKDLVNGPCTVESKNSYPLQYETVWLKQQVYETAESVYHKMLAAGDSHKFEGDQYDLTGSQEELNKKLQVESSALLKTSKTIWSQLEQIEKAQNQKAQVVRDVVARLALAVEEYQTKMSHELVQNAGQLQAVRSLVVDAENVVNKINSNLARKKWGSFDSHDEYCQVVTDHITQLDNHLHSCFNLFNGSQGEISKPDINRIIGEINKIFVSTNNNELDTFSEKKDVVKCEIKQLIQETTDSRKALSDNSLEGSCSDDSENETGRKSQTDVIKSKTCTQDKKQHGVRPTRNSLNNNNLGNKVGKFPPRTDTARPYSAINFSLGMPVKRTAQGVHSYANKKPELFQFRGMVTPTHAPFLNQPGLLGPRPNIMPLQGTPQGTAFRFSNFSAPARQNVQPVVNSGVIPNLNSMSVFGQPRSSNINFNFSNSQPQVSPFGIGSSNFSQNSLLASMGLTSSSSHQTNQAAQNIMSNQIKQSKLLQMQQSQQKGNKLSDQLTGAKSGVFYPFQQNSSTPMFMQKSQANMVGGQSLGGMNHDRIEQQLNEMTKKLQQMQLAASQNMHLQQLMRETERLKQLVAQKQHQQQDQIKHQFQLLINAFMQQQQQQLLQGPQIKMARSVQFFNSQKQQQRNLLIKQQQTKRLKQETKSQQVKQELQHENNSVSKAKEPGSSSKSNEAVIQNGKEDLKESAEKRKVISENCKVSKIGTFSPHTHSDKHRAGISSVVVMEDIGCVVVVDIINSCLKLYNFTVTNNSPMELTHHLVNRLELSRPYYMSKLNNNMIVVSREGKIISLVKVSKNKLECLKDLSTGTQYYGLGYVSENVIVCAAFADGKIDLLNVEDGVTKTVTLLTQCKGPELVAAIPSTGCILYLERVVNETVHLLGISQKGSIEFTIDLESSPTDVWSVAAISDKIISCSKESGKVKLFSKSGSFVADVNFPAGFVNQPFAMAFCDSGNMYIANDGAWDSDYEHYVTTEINVYSFS